jgi:hypothetical protein
MVDAVRTAEPQWQAAREAFKYIGKDAVVILNKRGQVVTTFARGSRGIRNPSFADPRHQVSSP